MRAGDQKYIVFYCKRFILLFYRITNVSYKNISKDIFSIKASYLLTSLSWINKILS